MYFLLTIGCYMYQVQNGRPPGNKDVEYDEMGNVIAVMRLDAEKLPNHRYVCCSN